MGGTHMDKKQQAFQTRVSASCDTESTFFAKGKEGRRSATNANREPEEEEKGERDDASGITNFQMVWRRRKERLGQILQPSLPSPPQAIPPFTEKVPGISQGSISPLPRCDGPRAPLALTHARERR